MPLMQWTTVRLVVSENDGRPSRQRNGTSTTAKWNHRGEEAYLRFARGDETRLLGLRKTARSNSGAECRDKNGRLSPPMHSLTTDHDKRLVAGAAPCRGGLAVSSISGEEQAMDICLLVPTKLEALPPQWTCNGASGPQRIACPGTLISPPLTTLSRRRVSAQ